MEPVGRNADSEAEFEKALRGSWRWRSDDDAGLLEKLSCRVADRILQEPAGSLYATAQKARLGVRNQWSRSNT